MGLQTSCSVIYLHMLYYNTLYSDLFSKCCLCVFSPRGQMSEVTVRQLSRRKMAERRRQNLLNPKRRPTNTRTY